MELKCGRVHLVGAGCGPAGWITVQGLRLLQTCDAVVYDDLIADDLRAATNDLDVAVKALAPAEE